MEKDRRVKMFLAFK